MKNAWHFAWVAAAGFWAAGAQAQGAAAGLEVEPSANGARCVVMSREPLAYPRGMAAQKTGGIVRVRLTFEASGIAPRAEVFFDTIGDVFRALVLERVQGYRLPCLRPGDQPVAATQEFVFTPGDGRSVVWSPLRDQQRQAAESPLACLTGADKVPDYPASRVGNDSGTVFVRYAFTQPDAAPQVAILFDGGNRRFAEVVTRYAAGLRLPCLAANDAPVSVVQPFHFAVQGKSRSALRDMTLATFVAALDKLEEQRVKFDFSTMSCPFDVRFVLRQPVLYNEIGEVERSNPNRREFIEWLKSVSLRIPESARAQVLGDSMTLSVPCGVLDLG